MLKYKNEEELFKNIDEEIDFMYFHDENPTLKKYVHKFTDILKEYKKASNHVLFTLNNMQNYLFFINNLGIYDLKGFEFELASLFDDESLTINFPNGSLTIDLGLEMFSIFTFDSGEIDDYYFDELYDVRDEIMKIYNQ